MKSPLLFRATLERVPNAREKIGRCALERILNGLRYLVLHLILHLVLHLIKTERREKANLLRERTEWVRNNRSDSGKLSFFCKNTQKEKEKIKN